jgi:hypothetical protein
LVYKLVRSVLVDVAAIVIPPMGPWLEIALAGTRQAVAARLSSAKRVPAVLMW